MSDKLQHHEFTAEWVNDEKGPAILLSQQEGSYDEPTTVLIHPWQLRAVCEKFGLFPTSDPQGAKTIATLSRRLLVLRDRIDHMAYWLANHSDSKHADLSYEQTYATATADIAAEFVAELDDAQTGTEPPEQAPGRVKPSTGTDTRQMSIESL